MSRVVALSGGIGGAKLALGMSRIMPPEALLVIANTGDDFEHLGLHISPDVDTLMYTLAGLDNTVLGWGRRDESWAFMESLAALGGETWFRLGDRDLAVHVERTRRLAAGEMLSAITDLFCRRLGVVPRILPMSDDRVRTRVHSDEGVLDFQDYFVGRQCRPVVRELVFEGSGTARAHPDFLAALADPETEAVVICPSNPFISIEPILAVPGVREALRICAAPVIAVSPIIAGKAVKGPTAKIMTELGSNAILCSPPDAVPFRFGDDSFFPHLAAARARGIEPRIVALPGIAMDIDHPADLARFLTLQGETRTRRWLEANGLVR